jgi:hypothetical protein
MRTHPAATKKKGQRARNTGAAPLDAYRWSAKGTS